MQTIDHITIQADPDAIFRAAADIERWPKILPHYRWVKVLEQRGDERVVEMAARRGLIPVKWIAVQTPDPTTRRVHYLHTGGPTRGMRVEWSINRPDGDDGVRVVIVHEFCLEAPVVRSSIGKAVVDGFFVKYIAGHTLACMKQFLEDEGGVACDEQW